MTVAQCPRCYFKHETEPSGYCPRLDEPQPRPIPPRWAFERVEELRCAYQHLQPNPLNIDVVMENPVGWAHYHAWADYVARMELPR